MHPMQLESNQLLNLQIQQSFLNLKSLDFQNIFCLDKSTRRICQQICDGDRLTHVNN